MREIQGQQSAQHRLAAGLFVLAGALAPHAAFAAGGNDGTQSNISSTCPKGKVWSKKDKKCVTARSGILPDDQLTDDAFVLAKAKRFDEALAVLNLLQDPNTPTALNYRGYVTRHLGRVDEGISFISNRSHSIRTMPRCANIWAKPMSSRAASIWPGSNSMRSRRSANGMRGIRGPRQGHR